VSTNTLTLTKEDYQHLLEVERRIQRDTAEQRNEYFKLYSDLRNAVSSFFAYHWDDDGIELSIEDVNAFFTENNIPLEEEDDSDIYTIKEEAGE